MRDSGLRTGRAIFRAEGVHRMVHSSVLGTLMFGGADSSIYTPQYSGKSTMQGNT
jgi:hypothetical protein